MPRINDVFSERRNEKPEILFNARKRSETDLRIEKMFEEILTRLEKIEKRLEILATTSQSNSTGPKRR